MTVDDFLQALAAARSDEVVITTMTAAVRWTHLSGHPLDLNYIPSSMGQGPALGLGLALARPERRVIVVNGDGCLLMNLGCLVTIAGLGPVNYTLVNIENSVYQLTGGQPVPGSGLVSFPGLARSAGWREVHEFDGLRPSGEQLQDVFRREGPVFVNVKAEARPGGTPRREPPICERVRHLGRLLTEQQAR